LSAYIQGYYGHPRELIGAIQAMFGAYALLGAVSLWLYRPLSAAIEAPDTEKSRPAGAGPMLAVETEHEEIV